MTGALIAGLLLFPNTAYMQSVQTEIDNSKEAAKQAAKDDKDLITGKGKVDVDIDVDNQEKPPADERTDEMFELKGVEIESELKKIQQKDVQHLIDPYLNKQVGIPELRELTNKIKDFCRRQGYLAAVAYLPEQDSDDGIVKISVTSAKFNVAKFKNESTLADDILREVGRKISDKKFVSNERIEDVLYRINEIGGVKARGALVPDVHTHGVDVHINVTNNQKNHGILYVENYGNKNSGRYRAGLIYDMYNLDNRGSRLEVSGLLSNEDLDNYAIDYSVISNRRTTSRAGISIGRTSYHLAKDFEAMDAGGRSIDFKVYGITPIYKTIHNGLDLNYSYKYRKVDEYVGLIKTIEHFFGYKTGDGEPESNVRTFAIGLNGYKRSLHNALFNYGFTIYHGHLSSRNEDASIRNQIRHTAGDFTRSELKLDYRQLFTDYWEVHTNFKLQNSSKALGSSEQLQLGGANGVRGYSDGDASGDEGYMSTTEVVWHTKVPGLTFNVFFDIGGAGNKRQHDIRTIRSWGSGLGYSQQNNFFLKFEYARKIGLNKEVTNDFSRNRLWFMAGKIF